MSGDGRREKFANVDVIKSIGRRAAMRRAELGASVAAVAKQMGWSRQQLYKIEMGEVRITADRLLQLAGILEVPPGWFFEG